MPDNRISVLIHFVWATWNREPLIQTVWERELYRIMEAAFQNNRCIVVAIGGTENHIHALASITNTTTLAKLMHDVKGETSHFINARYTPPFMFRWQGSYGAFSVSAHDKERVATYIRNQKEHHANDSLWPRAEQSSNEYITENTAISPW